MTHIPVTRDQTTTSYRDTH